MEGVWTPDLPSRVVHFLFFFFFLISHELLSAHPAVQGRKKADDFPLSLLISQLLGLGRTPRVSSFYIHP